jgi:hypothetical protein
MFYKGYWEYGNGGNSWETASARTFVHEMAHNAWQVVTDDWSNPAYRSPYISFGKVDPVVDYWKHYGTINASGLANDNPNGAIINADNYALFAWNLSGMLEPDDL